MMTFYIGKVNREFFIDTTKGSGPICHNPGTKRGRDLKRQLGQNINNRKRAEPDKRI